MRGLSDPRRKLRHRLARILFPIQSFLSALFFTPPVRIPVPVLHDRARPGERSRSLVVLLPGRGSRGKDFQRKGFVSAARDVGLESDVVAVDLHYGYYLKGLFLDRLWNDVVGPATAQGYEEIYLVGISMGAAGALGLAREHPRSIRGVVLIAPFLGPGEMVEAIQIAGGLRKWAPKPSEPASAFEAFFAANWEWIRSLSSDPDAGPRLTLAFGEGDRFAGSLRLVAEVLPPGRVFTAPGGHDWGTWRTLWIKMLRAGVLPLHRSAGEEGRPAVAP